MKNVVLFNLAFVNKSTDDSVETNLYPNKEGYMLAAAHDNEAAIRYIGSKVQREGGALDRMFVFVPKGADEEITVLDAAGNPHRTTHLDFLRIRLELGYPQLSSKFTCIDVDLNAPVAKNVPALEEMVRQLTFFAEKTGASGIGTVTMHADMSCGALGAVLLTAALKRLQKEGCRIGHIVRVDEKSRTIGTYEDLSVAVNDVASKDTQGTTTIKETLSNITRQK